MAVDSGLENRLRTALGDQADVTERRMFGGLAFLLRGNMCCGIHQNDLLVRVPPERNEQLLARPGAKPFVMGNRPPAKGWLIVSSESLSDEALQDWVGEGVAFASSLPPK